MCLLTSLNKKKSGILFSSFFLKFAINNSFLQFVKRALKIITNKFFIVSVAFLLLMLFFDQNDWFTQRERSNELRKTEESIRFLQSEVKRMNNELDDLNKPEKLEQYAREKYHEKRDGEDVYLIIKDSI